jgi:hypothetical protein
LLVNRARLASALIALIALSACNPAPSATTGASTAVATPLPSPALTAVVSSPSAAAASGSAPVAGASGDLVCAKVAELRTELAALKSLDPKSASTTDLREAARLVGQTGAQLIVLHATSEHLQALNIGAQFVLGVLDTPSATSSDRSQALQQFANTAQLVIDDISTCG